ncbi:hypothetical protein ILYODFUR_018730, partial [Ilyodon furcidens]
MFLGNYDYRLLEIGSLFLWTSFPTTCTFRTRPKLAPSHFLLLQDQGISVPCSTLQHKYPHPSYLCFSPAATIYWRFPSPLLIILLTIKTPLHSVLTSERFS